MLARELVKLSSSHPDSCAGPPGSTAGSAALPGRVTVRCVAIRLSLPSSLRGRHGGPLRRERRCRRRCTRGTRPGRTASTRSRRWRRSPSDGFSVPEGQGLDHCARWMSRRDHGDAIRADVVQAWVVLAVLHLHSEGVELVVAYVFQGVRRERCAPDGCTQDRRRFRRPGIGQHIPIGISADEVARCKDIEDASPSVGVHRHRGTRWNTSIENSDPIVFEEDRMEPWRRDHGVEVIGPRPRGGCAAADHRDTFRIAIAISR